MADLQAWWQVEEGAFVKEHFDELCWTLTAKKNYRVDSNGNSMLSNQDAFRLWCLFNFLSEDKYPLIMVPDEVRVMAAPGTAPVEARPQPNHEGSPVAFVLSHIPFPLCVPMLMPVSTQLPTGTPHGPCQNTCAFSQEKQNHTSSGPAGPTAGK